MTTKTAFNRLSHIFRPSSWPHTIAGGLLIAAFVVLLPFLFAIL